MKNKALKYTHMITILALIYAIFIAAYMFFTRDGIDPIAYSLPIILIVSVIWLYFKKSLVALSILFVFALAYTFEKSMSAYENIQDKFERGMTDFSSVYVMISESFYTLLISVLVPLVFYLSMKELRQFNTKKAVGMTEGGVDGNSSR